MISCNKQTNKQQKKILNGNKRQIIFIYKIPFKYLHFLLSVLIHFNYFFFIIVNVFYIVHNIFGEIYLLNLACARARKA